MSDAHFTADIAAIKPYTPSEIAELYGISRKVMNRWLLPHLDEIGTRQGRYYTALQVKTIFEKLGLPGKLKED